MLQYVHRRVVHFPILDLMKSDDKNENEMRKNENMLHYHYYHVVEARWTAAQVPLTWLYLPLKEKLQVLIIETHLEFTSNMETKNSHSKLV